MDNNQVQTNDKISDELLEKIYKDRLVRMAMAKESHFWFFHIYLSRYIKSGIAPFHKEMFKLTEDQNIPLTGIIAFRSSAKSTIVITSTAIWSVVGKPQKKFVVIITKNQTQAKNRLNNIKKELESNGLLINDFGQFQQQNSEWTAFALELSGYNARIIACSRDEGIRGLLNRENRPDLILVDDVEDNNSIRNKEVRDDTYSWFCEEVMPLGTTDTKIMAVGNLLHKDSLLMRLKKKIEAKELRGVFKSYPLLDAEGNSTWPARFPPQEIEKIKSTTDPIALKQEYLLTLVDEHERIIQPEQISHYDKINENKKHFCYYVISVDPAFSEKEKTDFTAIITGEVYRYNSVTKIYILQTISQRMNPVKTMETIQMVYNTFKAKGATKVFVEGGGNQGSIASTAKTTYNVPITEVVPRGDKRTRLSMAAISIINGRVSFPRNGCKDLTEQIVDFGSCDHDDLADALSMLINQVEIDTNQATPEFFMLK